MDFVKSHLDLEKSEPKVFNWSVSFFRSDFLQNPYFNEIYRIFKMFQKSSKRSSASLSIWGKILGGASAASSSTSTIAFLGRHFAENAADCGFGNYCLFFSYLSGGFYCLLFDFCITLYICLYEYWIQVIEKATQKNWCYIPLRYDVAK